MINILMGGSSSGIGHKLFAFLPFVTMKKGNNPGVSKKSDGTTDADGTLYPFDLNNASQLGSLKSFAAQMANYSLGLTANTDRIADGATKTFVGENYFSKYKRFKYAKVFVGKQWFSAISGVSLLNGHVSWKAVELDANRVLITYQSSGGTWYSQVITRDANDVITVGGPVLTQSTSNGYNLDNWDLVLVNTDRVLFVNPVTIKIISISGDVPSIGGTEITNTTSSNYNRIAKVDTDKAIWVYNEASVIKARIITVSGTTPTLQTAAANSDNGNYPSIIMDSSTKGFISYHVSTQQKGLVVGISGNTVTLNTSANIGSTGEHQSFAGMQVKLATDKFLIMTGGSAGAGKAFVISVSGTSFTSTTNTLTNVIKNAQISSFIEVSAGATYIFHQSSSNEPYFQARKLSISGTTVTQDSFKDIGTFVDSSQGVTYDYKSIVVIPWGTTDTFVLGTKYTNGSISSFEVAIGYKGTVSYEFYNDATKIGSTITSDYSLFQGVHDLNHAITTGKKCYFGIKNTTGGSAVRFVSLQELVVEVE